MSPFDELTNELAHAFVVIAEEELPGVSYQQDNQIDYTRGGVKSFWWTDPKTDESYRIEACFHFSGMIWYKLRVDFKATRPDCQREFPRICLGMQDHWALLGVVLYDVVRWTTHKAPTNPELLRLFTAT